MVNGSFGGGIDCNGRWSMIVVDVEEEVVVVEEGWRWAILAIGGDDY